MTSRHPKRRTLVMGPAALGLWLAHMPSSRAWSLGDLLRPQPKTPDEELKHRYRGVYGAALRVDATFRTDTSVIINVELGMIFNIGLGIFGPGGAKHSSYSASKKGDRLGFPKRLRYMRFPDDAEFLGYETVPPYTGTPLVDVTVPVAERVPEETLDAVRAGAGGLSLKLRIHPDTLLVGWDIESRPGYDPKKLDQFGRPYYVEAVQTHVGGDFREAKIFNGKVVRAGWYIDPKTKERIETDF